VRGRSHEAPYWLQPLLLGCCCCARARRFSCECVSPYRCCRSSIPPYPRLCPACARSYPKVNTLDPTGRYFAFFDFAQLHVIDLSTYQLMPNAGGGYWGAPRAVGFPVWTA
jgi:hypothetical protein